MLPQSKFYLMEGGYSARQASFILIGLFLAGVIVIRLVSSIMHHFIPSHVVDCDHVHVNEEQSDPKHPEDMAEQSHEEQETTPLLSRHESDPPTQQPSDAPSGGKYGNGSLPRPDSRRQSRLGRTLSRTYSKYVQGQKDNCDESGPCKGYSDLCGPECFRFLQRRTSAPTQHGGAHQPGWAGVNFATTVPEETSPDLAASSYSPHDVNRSRAQSNAKSDRGLIRSRSVTHYDHHPENNETSRQKRSVSSYSQTASEGLEHHHHVPTNAFMSIGLQTSIAIALHKAPEGFITYATNHANPTLGFAVFMALFIHNITEGFAMSLPLYLALNSRVKAIIWSSFLGGLSQPLGACIAALWFKLAQRNTGGGPDEAVYGGMFAITSGIMTSVALSLFSESLSLSHRKGICIAFAFIGMGVLGVSSALTAK